MSKNTTTLTIRKSALNEVVELVEHRNTDSYSAIFEKVADEFHRIKSCLEQNGLLNSLYPEKVK